jgi:hypothetical protein
VEIEDRVNSGWIARAGDGSLITVAAVFVGTGSSLGGMNKFPNKTPMTKIIIRISDDNKKRVGPGINNLLLSDTWVYLRG